MVLDVPQEIRQEDQESDRAADPDPGARERAALRSQHQADHDAGAEDQHGVLVFEADSRQDAEPDPEFRVAGLDDADEQVGATHPEQRLERVHGQQAVRGEECRRHQGRERRQALGKTLPAEFTRDQCGESNLGGAGHGGKEPDGGQGITEQRARQPGDHRNQRRLINVTPSQVPAASEVIEFVNKISVMPARRTGAPAA